MNLKKLKVPKRMRVTSMSPGKLKGMKMAKSIKGIKKINVAKKLKRSFNKKTTPSGGADGGAVDTTGGRNVATPRGSSKWFSTVRRKIMRPRLPHSKGGKKNSKNIIIIHNNTSITSNDIEDNRTSCVESNACKEIVSLKEEDVTSIDSAAPPPADDQASKEDDETDQEEFFDSPNKDDEEEADKEDFQETMELEQEADVKEDHQETIELKEEDKEILTLREEKASIHIQAVFRGHLARRAFRALKSLVKLQAVVRGVCVRRQARMALHCMNTLVRLQVRVRARQFLSRPSDAVEA